MRLTQTELKTIVAFCFTLSTLLLIGCLNESPKPDMIHPTITSTVIQTSSTIATTTSLSLPTTTTTTTSTTSSTTTITTTTTSTTTSTTLPAVVKKYDLDVIYKTDTTQKPHWLVDNFQGKGSPPWDGSIYMATSKDGLNFEDSKLFIDRAGVPNLLLTSKGTLIATFQYFTFAEQEMFDVIAYTVSHDSEKTWKPVNKIGFEGKGFEPEKIGPGSPNPVDPTLVELEDGTFRLYFTFHPIGSQYPTLFSARSTSLDTLFKVEGQQLDTNRMILDPALIQYKGLWHHYTVLHGEKIDNKHVNVHSTSPSGLNFEQHDDILLEFQLLGQVIEDDGKLRFYGSGEGVKSATSIDGYDWSIDPGTRVDGADPGVAKLPDKSYLIIYTKLKPK